MRVEVILERVVLNFHDLKRSISRDQEDCL